MKLLYSFTTALLASAATASWFQNEQKALDEEPLPVPGDNPLVYCNKPNDYLLTINKVNLDPNPPEAGTPLSIQGSGYLARDIEEGAKVHLQVKYGLVRILNQEVELCDYADEVDLKCPLEKGDVQLTKKVDLPKEIPPGKYTVLADIYTVDGEKITCLTASIIFARH